MVLPKRKKEKVEKYLKDRKTWEYIRNKTGVSNDTINKIRQESASPPPSTPPQPDKTPRVLQDQTDQKKEHPSAINKPNPHIQQLEQRINHLEQSQKTKEPTIDPHILDLEQRVNDLELTQKIKEPAKNSHLENPHTEQKPDAVKHQYIPKNPQPSTGSGIQPISKIDLDQTLEPLEETEEESGFEIKPYHVKAGFELIRGIKEIYDAYKHWQQTGVYIWPPKKENEKMTSSQNKSI